LARPVGMAALQAATTPYALINRRIESALKLTPLWQSFCWRVALSSESIKKPRSQKPMRGDYEYPTGGGNSGYWFLYTRILNSSM